MICVQQAQQMVASFEQHLREESGITLDEYLQAEEQFDKAFSMMEKRPWQQALEGFQAVLSIPLILNPMATWGFAMGTWVANKRR